MELMFSFAFSKRTWKLDEMTVRRLFCWLSVCFFYSSHVVFFAKLCIIQLSVNFIDEIFNMYNYYCIGFYVLVIIIMSSLMFRYFRTFAFFHSGFRKFGFLFVLLFVIQFWILRWMFQPCCVFSLVSTVYLLRIWSLSFHYL